MNKIIKFFCFFVFVTLLAVFYPRVSFAYEFTDEIGRKVNIDTNPRRIVSLAPGITETLYELGLKESIVGVTTFCDWPDDVRHKEQVGGFTNPSIEKIVSLNPDLILATADGNRKDTVRQLEKLGLSVYVINPSDIKETLKSILNIGKITNHMQQAKNLNAKLQERLNNIAAQTRYKKKPRVFFQIGLEPIISVGAETLINEAIEHAGGVNVAGQNSIRYPRYSTEGIVAAAPDIILFAAMTRNKEIEARAFFSEKLDIIPAVKNGRIYSIDTDLISRASPRMVDAIEQMALIFHPEININK